MDCRLIVGLGNIGEKYTFTRHNVGFLFLDKISEYYSVKFKKSEYSTVADFNCEGVRVLFVKPTTFMNSSGVAVSFWKNFFKISNDNILVISDDLNLNLGVLRFRSVGGAGGHNGLKSIENIIGNDYFRLKIGIGNNYDYGEQSDFVLSNFSSDELKLLFSGVDCVLKFVDSFIKTSDKSEKIKNLNNIISRGVISSVG